MIFWKKWKKIRRQNANSNHTKWPTALLVRAGLASSMANTSNSSWPQFVLYALWIITLTSSLVVYSSYIYVIAYFIWPMDLSRCNAFNGSSLFQVGKVKNYNKLGKSSSPLGILGRPQERNIAKGTTDPRVEFILQFLSQILIKFHLQNLERVSTSKYQPNISIST